MSDNEALIRLEQKIDLIIYALQSKGIMIQDLPDLNGIEQDNCVLCKQPIKILINPKQGTLVRACGCSLPKKAYKLELTTQVKEASHADNRDTYSEIPPNPEE